MSKGWTLGCLRAGHWVLSLWTYSAFEYRIRAYSDTEYGYSAFEYRITAYSDTEYRIRVYSDTEYGCIRILNTGYLTNELFLDGFFFSFIFMYWLYHCWDVAL